MPRKAPRTAFKPGQSGNPNGRPPKGYSITEMFKSMLTNHPEIKEAITKSITKKALEGDATAIKLVWSYMDGLPKQNLDVTSGGKPIPLLTGVADVPSNDSVKEVTTDKETD